MLFVIYQKTSTENLKCVSSVQNPFVFLQASHSARHAALTLQTAFKIPQTSSWAVKILG